MIPLPYEAPKIIKLIEAEGGMVSAGRRKREGFKRNKVSVLQVALEHRENTTRAYKMNEFQEIWHEVFIGLLTIIMHHAFKSLIRCREMAQSARCLPCKDQNLNLSFQHHTGNRHYVCVPVLLEPWGKQNTVPGSLPHANLAESVNSRFSERLVAKKIRKWKAL